MVVFILVALFSLALILTLIGSCLSPRSRAHKKRKVTYVPRSGRGPSQGDRTRNVRRMPVEDRPYGQLKRPSAPLRDVDVERGLGRRTAPIRTGDLNGREEAGIYKTGDRKRREGESIRGTGDRAEAMGRSALGSGEDQPLVPVLRAHRSLAPALMGQAPSRRDSAVRQTSVKDVVALRSASTSHWLNLTLLGAIFCICLFLFELVTNFGHLPTTAIISGFGLQPAPVPASQAVYGEDLGVSSASKSLVRLGQSDPNQYSSQDEYNQWVDSACSAASMTEIINAYGHDYRITDILKIESGLHEITPELGLLEPKGVDRTMAQFGFKMVPLQHATLDDTIAIANQGHPVIVGFASSSYWSGGHILVVRGGDAQNVDLADSSRLNLTVVARSQFLQWWDGFTSLAIPQ